MEQSQVPPMGAHKASQKAAAVVDDLLKEEQGATTQHISGLISLESSP